jgi:hypothetical protein
MEEKEKNGGLLGLILVFLLLRMGGVDFIVTQIEKCRVNG